MTSAQSVNHLNEHLGLNLSYLGQFVRGTEGAILVSRARWEVLKVWPFSTERYDALETTPRRWLLITREAAIPGEEGGAGR